MELLVGADPEFFLKRKRHFISGHIFPCGTKQKPREMVGYDVQVDGIALEINVKPSKTAPEFAHNLLSARKHLQEFVQLMDQDVSLVARPSIFFGQRRLNALPTENAALGCTPDFNAYSESLNPRPDSTSPIRTGAGHIHIGWGSGFNPLSRRHINDCAKIVKELDFFLGLPSLLWDKDTRRRSLYGCAGAFRPKPYGLEYRVLSNKWCDTDKHVKWVFDQTIRAFTSYATGCGAFSSYGNMAQDAINNNRDDWHKRAPILAQMVMSWS